MASVWRHIIQDLDVGNIRLRSQSCQCNVSVVFLWTALQIHETLQAKGFQKS